MKRSNNPLDRHVAWKVSRHVLPSIAALALVCQPIAVFAGGFSGGLIVQGETFNPQHPNAPPSYQTMYGNSGVITRAIQRAWSQYASDTCSAIETNLGHADALGKGYTPYNISCSMGDASNASVSASVPFAGQPGNEVDLDVLVPGNYLEFTTTQPSVFGSYADPRFSVAYNVGISAIVLAKGTNLSVSYAQARMENAKVDSHNAVADELLAYVRYRMGGAAANNLIDQELGQNVQDVSKLVNANLVTLNALLGGFAQSGGYDGMTLEMTQNTIDNVPPSSVLVRLTASSFKVSFNGSGTVSGAVRWDSSAGQPSYGCAGVGVQALAATGYQQQGQFVAPQTQVGTTSMAGMISLQNLTTRFHTFVTQNPTGSGSVSDIDFAITFMEGPQ